MLDFYFYNCIGFPIVLVFQLEKVICFIFILYVTCDVFRKNVIRKYISIIFDQFSKN